MIQWFSVRARGGIHLEVSIEMTQNGFTFCIPSKPAELAVDSKQLSTFQNAVVIIFFYSLTFSAYNNCIRAGRVFWIGWGALTEEQNVP